jgi:hypothetical protein
MTDYKNNEIVNDISEFIRTSDVGIPTFVL